MKKPTLTDAGTSVRLLIKAEPAATCAEVADVNTANDWFTDEAFVKVQLRNRAAELGANVATLDVLKHNDNNLYGGSGRAFKCP